MEKEESPQSSSRISNNVEEQRADSEKAEILEVNTSRVSSNQKDKIKEVSEPLTSQESEAEA